MAKAINLSASKQAILLQIRQPSRGELKKFKKFFTMFFNRGDRGGRRDYTLPQEGT